MTIILEIAPEMMQADFSPWSSLTLDDKTYVYCTYLYLLENYLFIVGRYSNRVLTATCGKINTNWASITNWGKIISAATNRSNSYYKSWQFQLLQIGAKLIQIGAVITNWGRIITNWGGYYKLEQLLQIGAEHPSKIQSQQKHNSLHF